MAPHFWQKRQPGLSSAPQAQAAFLASWAPQAVQTLPDAHVIELAGVGHLTLAYDRHAWGLVAQALGGRQAG